MKKQSFGGSAGGRNGKSRSFGKKFVKTSSNGGWKQVGARKVLSTPPAFVKKSAAAKLVQSLSDKKTRMERGLFIAEGRVTVLEMLESGFRPHALFVTNEFLDEYPEILENFKNETHRVDAAELTSMGTLAQNDAVIGVLFQKPLPAFSIGNEIVLVVSEINDPGNLGTLIRIADWYGIGKIVASRGTVDGYNPKVISATKGSFARVELYYQDLEKTFLANKNIPVFAADMRGENVHDVTFPRQGFLLLGNETHGIPEDLSHCITKRITIPRFGNAESLNVAIAGAVILDNWKR